MSKLSPEALQRFAELHPERFAELQERAKQEFDKPTIRPTRYSTISRGKIDVDTFLSRYRAEHGIPYLVTTQSHRFCESGHTPEEAIENAKRRHPLIWDGHVLEVEALA